MLMRLILKMPKLIIIKVNSRINLQDIPSKCNEILIKQLECMSGLFRWILIMH